jgi:hypothetical protein
MTKSLCRYAVLLFAGLSSVAGAASDEIRVYEPGTLTRDRYEVVERLWVDSWRGAVYIPGHADQTAAIAAMKDEALRGGPNALTNVACLAESKPLWGSGPHFCYALAIRVK